MGLERSRTTLTEELARLGDCLRGLELTISDKPQIEGTTMPISQISIELYKPVTGGIFFGSRFAPEGLKVKGMKDYTPKKTN